MNPRLDDDGDDDEQVDAGDVIVEYQEVMPLLEQIVS